MQKSRHDLWVGLFVVIGAVALLFLALKAGNLLSLSFEPVYRVSARLRQHRRSEGPCSSQERRCGGRPRDAHQFR